MKRTATIVFAAAAVAACNPSGSKGGGSHDTGGQGAQATAPAGKAAQAPEATGPLPPPPAWAAGYMGKLLTDVVPQTGQCNGNTDKVLRRYAGPPAGIELVGWGWESAAGKHVDRVLLVDENLRIIGAGEGGRPRKDVPRVMPLIKDPATGWRGVATVTAGLVQGYGLVDGGRAVCPLGQLEL